jgi:hypothetical protein
MDRFYLGIWQSEFHKKSQDNVLTLSTMKFVMHGRIPGRLLLSRARFRFRPCPKIEKCKPYSGLTLNCKPIPGFVTFYVNFF